MAVLKKEGIRQKGLKELPKGDERKVRVAQRLRKETAMSMRWIGQRLEMGVPGHLANLLTQQKVKK